MTKASLIPHASEKENNMTTGSKGVQRSYHTSIKASHTTTAENKKLLQPYNTSEGVKDSAT